MRHLSNDTAPESIYAGTIGTLRRGNWATAHGIRTIGICRYSAWRLARVIRGVGGRTPGRRLVRAPQPGRGGVGPERQDRIVSAVAFSISHWVWSNRADFVCGNAGRVPRPCRPCSSGFGGWVRTSSEPRSGGIQNACVGPQPHRVRDFRRGTFFPPSMIRAPRCLPLAPGNAADSVGASSCFSAASPVLRGDWRAPPRSDLVRPKPSAGTRTSFATPSRDRRSIPAGVAAQPALMARRRNGSRRFCFHALAGAIEPRRVPAASDCGGACTPAPRPRILARGQVPAGSRDGTGCPRTDVPGVPLEHIMSAAVLAPDRRARR